MPLTGPMYNWAIQRDKDQNIFLNFYPINGFRKVTALEKQGLLHGDALLNAWGVFVALVSAALIGLGGTGVYMWFKIYDERLVGGLIFISGLAISFGLLVATRLQP